jgi:hypothetical protein
LRLAPEIAAFISSFFMAPLASTCEIVMVPSFREFTNLLSGRPFFVASIPSEARNTLCVDDSSIEMRFLNFSHSMPRLI